MLRQKFLDADVGLTGANFLVAETGSSMLVTNEGNADLSNTLPRMHIVLASIEKVIPTLEDAAVLLRVLARSATGQEFSAYTTLNTGPKRPDDLDGPEQYHVVLLDNGRSSVLGTEMQDILRCIRCGACMNHCPVYGAVGGHAYGWVYPGPMGAVLTPQLVGVEEASNLPNASTFCGRCESVCPVRIPLPKLMRHWREREFEKHLTPKARAPGPGAVELRRPPAGALSTSHRSRQSRAGAVRPRRGPLSARCRSPAAGRASATCPRRSQAARSTRNGRRGRHERRPSDARARSWTASAARCVAASSPATARGDVDARLAAAAARPVGRARQLAAAREGRPVLPVGRDQQRHRGARRGAPTCRAKCVVYLARNNLPARAAMAPSPQLDGYDWASQKMLSICAAAAAKAATRSRSPAPSPASPRPAPLVMASGPDHPVTLNLLPDTHIVVLREADIVGGYEDVWGRLRARYGKDRMPRTVNTITGPSRTGDIEQAMELGAHGPRRMHILVVRD